MNLMMKIKTKMYLVASILVKIATEVDDVEIVDPSMILQTFEDHLPTKNFQLLKFFALNFVSVYSRDKLPWPCEKFEETLDEELKQLL